MLLARTSVLALIGALAGAGVIVPPAHGAPPEPSPATEKPPPAPDKSSPSEAPAAASTEPAAGSTAGPAQAHKGSGKAPKSQAKAPSKHPAQRAQPSKRRTSKKTRQQSARGPKRKPLPRRPGSQPGQPDESVRRTLTGRYPTLPEPSSASESAELKAMRDLDKVLFPPPGSHPPAFSTQVPLEDDGPQVDASGLPAAAPPPAASPPPAAEDVAWVTKLTLPDIPVRLEPPVVRYLSYYKNSPQGRQLVARWVEKSGRYRDAIVSLLRQYQLPEDLLWVALVESSFDPTIYSHAGAAGLWQFMPATGRVYGLTVNRRVDERLDPERSTHAALRHLKDLHTRFASWELALAAYNMGYGGLLSAIRKYNTNDYWELRRLEAGLPYETALYVPKIMAIAIAAKNCAVFGCDQVTPEAPRPFDKVSVGAGVSLETIADAAGADEAVIAELNPHLIGSRTPPLELAASPRQSWTVYVPPGKGQAVREKVSSSSRPLRLATHHVRWGESLDRIADRYQTSTKWLERVNDLYPHEPARPGAVIFVPKRPAAAAEPAPSPSPEQKPVAVVPDQEFRYRSRSRVFYEVVLGDTVEAVALICGVTAASIRRWNHLGPRAALQNGMLLQLFVESSARPANALLLEEDQVRVIKVESPEFFAYFEGQKQRRRLEVTVLEGDTWSKLAQRYGCSLGMLERINHRSRRSQLRAGERVIVYTRLAEAALPEASAAEQEAADDAVPEESPPEQEADEASPEASPPEQDAADDALPEA